MTFIDCLLAFCRAVVAPQPCGQPVTPSRHHQDCHTLQEALLVGLCLLRSGSFETMLYDNTMAHGPCGQQGALPTTSQSRGVAVVLPKTNDCLSLRA